MPITRRDFTRLGGAAVLAGAPLPVFAQTPDPLFQAQWTTIFGTVGEATQALESIVQRGQPDMAAGQILGMRFGQLSEAHISTALSALTGARENNDWFDWMLWQESHPEVVPHVTYAALMTEIFLRIDPNFADFLRPEYLTRDKARIRIEEIAWGGVRKDGIPSLDSPKMIAASASDYLAPDDLVFGVSINGDTRAYPLRIMGWHEMFNDVIGGVPVALAYCTLCGSGILFETQITGRRRPLIFGSSGFLYRSNKLMFDRETNSLWNQFTGQPVIGPLYASGIVLQQRPVVIDTWAHWAGAHPDSQVLSLDTGFRRDYGSGVVYNDYFASDDLMFPAVVDQRRFGQKSYVFGIRQFGGAKAWPLTAFAGHPVINDAIGDTPLVLIGDPQTRSARAFERGGLTFQTTAAGFQGSDGQVWSVTEEALIAPDGTRLPRVAGHVAYWFAWDGYVGAASEIYGQ